MYEKLIEFLTYRNPGLLLIVVGPIIVIIMCVIDEILMRHKKKLEIKETRFSVKRDWGFK